MSRGDESPGTPMVDESRHAGLRLLRGGKTRDYNQMLIDRIKGLPAVSRPVAADGEGMPKRIEDRMANVLRAVGYGCTN